MRVSQASVMVRVKGKITIIDDELLSVFCVKLLFQRCMRQGCRIQASRDGLAASSGRETQHKRREKGAKLLMRIKL
jgi:hypothetical protein